MQNLSNFYNKKIMTPVRNVCAKFNVDCLNSFCTGARRVLNPKKRFPSEIPLTVNFVFMDCNVSNKN